MGITSPTAAISGPDTSSPRFLRSRRRTEASQSGATRRLLRLEFSQPVISGDLTDFSAKSASCGWESLEPSSPTVTCKLPALGGVRTSRGRASWRDASLWRGGLHGVARWVSGRRRPRRIDHRASDSLRVRRRRRLRAGRHPMRSPRLRGPRKRRGGPSPRSPPQTRGRAHTRRTAKPRRRSLSSSVGGPRPLKARRPPASRPDGRPDHPRLRRSGPPSRTS